MISTPDPPPPDPAIKAQQIQADAARTREIQSGTGEDSLNLLRMFGQSNAMSYAGLGTGLNMTAPTLGNISVGGR